MVDALPTTPDETGDDAKTIPEKQMEPPGYDDFRFHEQLASLALAHQPDPRTTCYHVGKQDTGLYHEPE